MVTKKRVYMTILSLVLILNPLLLVIDRPANAVEIQDLTSCSAYARPAVERLVAQKVISGDQQGHFNPKNSVTRGEMITIIVRALAIEVPTLPTNPTFKDVPQSHWANKYVETAYARGIVQGLNPEFFGVDKKCTREEMAAMFVRAFKILDDSGSILALPTVNMVDFTDRQQLSVWAQDAMGFALYSGLLLGTGKTTLSPQGLAIREQAAVLVDRFLGRYNTIKADRKAATWLNNTNHDLTNASMLANHSTSSTQFTLWAAGADLPQEFAVTTDTNNKAVWPALLYSITHMEMPGLPQNEYPPYTFEQYLADSKVYEKTVDGDISSGWGHFPALTEDEVVQTMAEVKTSLVALLEPGLIAHQTGICTIEEVTTNGVSRHKITYTGNIVDLKSYLTDVLPNLMPQDTSSPQNWMDNIIAAFTSATYSQIYYVNTADGKLSGTELQVQINCRAVNNSAAIPIKTMVIKASTDNYLYNAINIVLPSEAMNAPEKQN